MAGKRGINGWRLAANVRTSASAHLLAVMARGVSIAPRGESQRRVWDLLTRVQRISLTRGAWQRHFGASVVVRRMRSAASCADCGVVGIQRGVGINSANGRVGMGNGDLPASH